MFCPPAGAEYPFFFQAPARGILEEQPLTKIPTNDLVTSAEFVLKNNLFEFDDNVKQQISGTAIGTKFTPPYACIYMYKTD